MKAADRVTSRGKMAVQAKTPLVPQACIENPKVCAASHVQKTRQLVPGKCSKPEPNPLIYLMDILGAVQCVRTNSITGCF